MPSHTMWMRDRYPSGQTAHPGPSVIMGHRFLQPAVHMEKRGHTGISTIGIQCPCRSVAQRQHLQPSTPVKRPSARRGRHNIYASASHTAGRPGSSLPRWQQGQYFWVQAVHQLLHRIRKGFIKLLVAMVFPRQYCLPHIPVIGRTGVNRTGHIRVRKIVMERPGQPPVQQGRTGSAQNAVRHTAPGAASGEQHIPHIPAPQPRSTFYTAQPPGRFIDRTHSRTIHGYFFFLQRKPSAVYGWACCFEFSTMLQNTFELSAPPYSRIQNACPCPLSDYPAENKREPGNPANNLCAPYQASIMETAPNFLRASIKRLINFSVSSGPVTLTA